MKYDKDHRSAISFPLGGIGTGCIGLAGSGHLVDWEIANHPNKCSTNRYSHFAIKAEADGTLLDARILNGDLPPPYMGNTTPAEATARPPIFCRDCPTSAMWNSTAPSRSQRWNSRSRGFRAR